MSDAQIAALERRHAHLRSQLAAVGEMRSGTLTERCRRCGKASCGCADRGASGRGPVLSLTRKQDGKTVTRLIPADAGAEVQAQNAEYRRFRELSKALIEVSDALSEARLAAGRPRPAAPPPPPAAPPPPPAAAEKGGSAEAFAVGINLKIATGIAELVGPGASGQDFEAFEQAVPRGVLDAAAGEVEHQLNADVTDSCGPTVVCACGQTARYAGRRPKTRSSTRLTTANTAFRISNAGLPSRPLSSFRHWLSSRRATMTVRTRWSGGSTTPSGATRSAMPPIDCSTASDVCRAWTPREGATRTC